jgi:hypothetical protein
MLMVYEKDQKVIIFIHEPTIDLSNSELSKPRGGEVSYATANQPL